MLKLNASFSKKVPAEQQYSSQSYHAAVEVEIPDGLTPQQLQERIRNTFALVRSSVEQEIQFGQPAVGGNSTVAQSINQAPVPQSQAPRNTGAQASPKQTKFLLDLATRQGTDPVALQQQLQATFGIGDVYSLNKKQCSQMIDVLQGKQRAA